MLGGQTQFMMPGLAAALQHIKGGKLRPLAVTGTRRHPALPDIHPRLKNWVIQALRQCSEYGIGQAGKIPAPVVARLNEVNKAIATPSCASVNPATLNVFSSSTSAEFSAFIEAEVARWSALVRTCRSQI